MKPTFADAVKSGLKNYANFKGTATRTEFWYFYLFCVLLNIVTSTLDAFISPSSTSGLGMATGGPLYLITNIALILPNLTLGIRRFHDAGFSGKWFLLWLIPVIAFFMGGGLMAANAPKLDLATASDQQLLDAALPLLPSLLLFLAVGIFQLIVNLRATKTAEQGNKYATKDETPTSATA
ncbi:MAG: DUF805 domain-containing protein [Rhodoluna sp.]